ncbi:MAG: error-prone DNA polymerase [Bdellovibrionales bacterium]|nr:error-prone DNA polymerase [Bdellovibrionales bacterium]
MDFEFHEWLCKTNFSFLMGASHPAQIVNTANELDYSSICINDFDGMYGVARSYNDLNYLKKDNEVKMKLNYGAEIHLQRDHNLPILKQNTIVLNALSWEGYKNINKILTAAHLESKDEAFITASDLTKYSLKDVFCILPMRGLINPSIQNIKTIRLLKEIFDKDLYLAKTKTFNHHIDKNLKRVNFFSKKLSVETIFSQDVFMHHRSEKSFHDLLMAIKHNMVVGDSQKFFFPNGELSLHTKDSLLKTYSRFRGYKKTLMLMSELNERAQFCLSELKYQYPKEFIPKEHTAQSFLELKTWEGAKSRYNGHIPTTVVTIISKELDLIEELGFADYFLTVWDIVAWARSQGILCQGRGSAANSSVCYSLGITSCDPSLFDLLFERFVSKERGDPPDIDVDFEHERREEVLQYIYRRYGRKKASMVANVITFRTKGALRAVGKAFGLNDDSLKVASNISSTVAFRREGIAAVVKETKKNMWGVKVPENFSWENWITLSSKLHGFPRHLGLHSGGFVISQNDISSLVPTEPATMEGRTVIQWCKDDIEELGFFKIDCLALGMLTAVRKCFEYVKECYDIDLDLYNLPQEDPATYSMIQKADTVGVFQIESRAQMSMLPRLKPKTFYDLVIEIAIIRPGPIQGKVIHPFLERRNGLKPVIYPSAEMESVLSKTLGVIIFQEQLMRIAIALGDFTPGEANELRKHIGAWNSKAFNRDLNPYITKLIKGLKSKGISQSFIKQMVEQMRGFAHYGFPESHAISFAFIAYASCYLKCHFPAAFFTSVLNSQPMGFYSPHSLLQAARQKGIKVLPLSVNHSGWDHTLEEVGRKEGRPKSFGIRLGFRIVKGLSERAVKNVLDVRNSSGLWDSINDFIQKTEINRVDYSAFAAANAFSCFGIERFDALWKVEAIPYLDLIDTEERKLKWKKKDEFQTSQLDFKATGTTLESHPAQLIKEKKWCYSIKKQLISTAASLERIKRNAFVHVFGMVIVKQAPPSAKGMVFITMEDETGFINLAFTPDIYRKFYKIIESSGYLCITGKLQKASNYHSILVTNCHHAIEAKIDSIAGQSHKSKLGIKGVKPRNYY